MAWPCNWPSCSRLTSTSDAALRKGDRFSVVYETLEADGEPLRSGRVLSAEFVNNGKTHQALWFQEPGSDKGAYYTLDGQSKRRAYLASPLEFSRVTSGFKPCAFTPSCKSGAPTWGPTLRLRQAPRCAPWVTAWWTLLGFRTALATWSIVKHRNQHVTVYAHLNRIDVKKGQSVSQGQNIGTVGATGWATGPHLHFEFRVDGQHQDPMVIARQSEAAAPVSAAARPAFDRLASTMRIELSSAALIEQASAE
jgi:murein DD-endopeptidase MepM/ murein hydrolase activator NlpD